MEETKHLKGSMSEIAEMAEHDAELDAEEDSEHEVDVLEFGLDTQGIDELIASLHELKEKRESVTFAIDTDNDLVIHYEDVDDADEMAVA